jgi:hypothetical protein
MSKLITLTELNIDNFLSMIENSSIIVYENIKGNKIFFTFEDGKPIIKTRTIKDTPLNKIDLALNKYYGKLWEFLESLDERIVKIIPKNIWFCCQYFYDTKPSNIAYDYVPTNNLILTSIIKDDKFRFDYDEILEYSNLLNIDPQPVIFMGKLNEAQIKLIKYFLYTDKKDLEFIFGEENDNFVSFFYKILNPQIKNSILMKFGQFQDNIDKIILRVNNEDEMSFSLLNPLYISNQKHTHTEYADTYSILLLDFLEYLQLVNIDSIKLLSKEGDSLYLEIMCELFNRYCDKRSLKIEKFDFTIPPFFYDDKYRLNVDNINDKKTKKFIKNDKLAYLLKIILGTFRSRKNKPIGVFNENTLKMLNTFIDKIDKIIDEKLRIVREITLSTDKLLDFDKFFNIEYPKDGTGDVYPDYYKELDVAITTQTDKKKKGIITDTLKK